MHTSKLSIRWRPITCKNLDFFNWKSFLINLWRLNWIIFSILNTKEKDKFWVEDPPCKLKSRVDAWIMRVFFTVCWYQKFYLPSDGTSYTSLGGTRKLQWHIHMSWSLYYVLIYSLVDLQVKLSSVALPPFQIIVRLTFFDLKFDHSSYSKICAKYHIFCCGLFYQYKFYKNDLN